MLTFLFNKPFWFVQDVNGFGRMAEDCLQLTRCLQLYLLAQMRSCCLEEVNILSSYHNLGSNLATTFLLCFTIRHWKSFFKLIKDWNAIYFCSSGTYQFSKVMLEFSSGGPWSPCAATIHYIIPFIDAIMQMGWFQRHNNSYCKTCVY